MSEGMNCKDGFCEFKHDVKAVKPEDVFFEPVKESGQAEDSKMRQRFLRFCDDHPDHEECRIYDV